MTKKLDYAYCRAAPLLEWLSNKWVPVVFLRIAGEESVRFNELYRTIPSISEKELAAALKQLTAEGLVSRTAYPDVPPRVEYAVTDFGRTLLPRLEALVDWGRENFDRILENRK